MNKKGIIFWFFLAGFFILLLTSLGIYIGISEKGVEIGLKSETNSTSQENTNNSNNLEKISIVPTNSNLITKNIKNNSLNQSQ